MTDEDLLAIRDVIFNKYIEALAKHDQAIQNNETPEMIKHLRFQETMLNDGLNAFTCLYNNNDFDHLLKE